jgi:hypothetical protein
MSEYFRVVEVAAQEVTDNLVIPFAIHTLLHGIRHFDAVPPGVFRPGNAVQRVGIDQDSIHIENEGADSVSGH